MKEALDWIQLNRIEVAAAAVSITYVILSVRQIKWLWWFGLASAILYAIVYLNAGFYAGMGLQFYYAAISFYGWWQWTRKHQGNESHGQLKVSHLRLKTGLILLLTFAILWSAISLTLFYGTDSKVPVWDGLISAGGIVATWMLARKILQHWLVWILIDAISIAVYAWQEMYATTVLFFIYVCTAIIGYSQWKKSMQKE
ncbi:MAG TPA: nicotinamide riboside transporter PnuC [Bacteroidales bacterium]|nr:nicotinamide riboside transporter PnuC [Bacteroidales bacterium]